MKTVIISSPLATQSGYGHHAREVISNFFNKKPADWEPLSIHSTKVNLI